MTDSVSGMRRIAVCLPDALVEALDMAATELNRSRAAIGSPGG